MPPPTGEPIPAQRAVPLLPRYAGHSRIRVRVRLVLPDDPPSPHSPNYVYRPYCIQFVYVHKNVLNPIPDEFLEEGKGWIAEIQATLNGTTQAVETAFAHAPTGTRKELALWCRSLRGTSRLIWSPS